MYRYEPKTAASTTTTTTTTTTGSAHSENQGRSHQHRRSPLPSPSSRDGKGNRFRLPEGKHNSCPRHSPAQPLLPPLSFGSLNGPHDSGNSIVDVIRRPGEPAKGGKELLSCSASSAADLTPATSSMTAFNTPHTRSRPSAPCLLQNSCRNEDSNNNCDMASSGSVNHTTTTTSSGVPSARQNRATAFGFTPLSASSPLSASLPSFHEEPGWDTDSNLPNDNAHAHNREEGDATDDNDSRTAPLPSFPLRAPKGSENSDPLPPLSSHLVPLLTARVDPWPVRDAEEEEGKRVNASLPPAPQRRLSSALTDRSPPRKNEDGEGDVARVLLLNPPKAFRPRHRQGSGHGTEEWLLSWPPTPQDDSASVTSLSSLSLPHIL